MSRENYKHIRQLHEKWWISMMQLKLDKAVKVQFRGPELFKKHGALNCTFTDEAY